MWLGIRHALNTGLARDGHIRREERTALWEASHSRGAINTIHTVFGLVLYYGELIYTTFCTKRPVDIAHQEKMYHLKIYWDNVYVAW